VRPNHQLPYPGIVVVENEYCVRRQFTEETGFYLHVRGEIGVDVSVFASHEIQKNTQPEGDFVYTPLELAMR
jgi:hypothetical protein